MSALTIIGLCLTGCAAIFGAFEVFVGWARWPESATLGPA